jgi:hypothetical protein
MGSLLMVIAVMVIDAVPVGVDGEVVSISTEWPRSRGVAGMNRAVAPAGRPVALRVTRVLSK